MKLERERGPVLVSSYLMIGSTVLFICQKKFLHVFYVHLYLHKLFKERIFNLIRNKQTRTPYSPQLLHHRSSLLLFWDCNLTVVEDVVIKPIDSVSICY